MDVQQMSTQKQQARFWSDMENPQKQEAYMRFVEEESERLKDTAIRAWLDSHDEDELPVDLEAIPVEVAGTDDVEVTWDDDWDDDYGFDNPWEM